MAQPTLLVQSKWFRSHHYGNPFENPIRSLIRRWWHRHWWTHLAIRITWSSHRDSSPDADLKCSDGMHYWFTRRTIHRRHCVLEIKTSKRIFRCLWRSRTTEANDRTTDVHRTCTGLEGVCTMQRSTHSHSLARSRQKDSRGHDSPEPSPKRNLTSRYGKRNSQGIW